MTCRRAAPLALFLALAACNTEVKQTAPPAEVVLAAFATDATNPAFLAGAPGPKLPQPNDLGMQAAAALPASAQKELLQVFAAAGGFPGDQEVPITIPVRALRFANGSYQPAAVPDLDLATVSANAVVLKLDGAVAPVAVEVGGYTKSTDGLIGTLTLRKTSVGGSRRWAPGRYAVALRGGSAGVKTTGGVPLSAEQSIQLVAANRDLANPDNQPPGGLSATQVAQLEGLRGLLTNALPWCNVTTPALGWNPLVPPLAAAGCGAATVVVPLESAFAAVATRFPLAELASIQTFQVASPGTVALIDPGSGSAPLPIDLLRTVPSTTAGGPNTIALNAAFGPAAQGLTTLDGFSTTAMLLAPTSGPIDAATADGRNLFLFRLNGVATPTPVRELKAELRLGGAGSPAAAGYVAEPTDLTRPCQTVNGPGSCATALGLAPAVGVSTTGGTVALPPLREGSSYAVVVTSRVKDPAGGGLSRSTVAKLLLEVTGDLSAGGHSTLAGVDDATALALQTMRTQLQPVLANLPAGTALADVAAAWTFRTQSIASTALQLSVLPYVVESGAGTAIFTPTSATAVTAPTGVPTANVAAFYDVAIQSVDAIDKTTGGLRPTLAADVAAPATLAPLLTPLHALVAVPDPAVVPACPAPFPAGTRCTRLVLFGHGLGGSKETLFAVASSLASQGLMAAALDIPLHGARAWCGSNADCTTGAADGVCATFPGAQGQGDAAPPAGFGPPGVCATGVPKAAVSGRYFVTANFFRTRDAVRQNLLDQAAATLALSRPPGLPTPTADPFAAALPAGLLVDPSAVYYEGISLGSIVGTSVVASNPRLRRASFSVGGGTMTDVFLNAPAFSSQVDALLLSLGVDRSQVATDPAVAAAYLQVASLAKWILDPADPINYAPWLRSAPLPDLLVDPTGATAQAAKDVYAQIATGDLVVPNPQNTLLDALSVAVTTTYTKGGGAAPHSMLATEPLVQLDAAGYLTGSLPPATRDLP